MSIEGAPSLNKPNPGRMYDYFLQGTDNFPVDRAAGDEVMKKVGKELTRGVVRENRDFQGRVVNFLAGECGIRQFIDLGSALPSMEHTHQVAQRVAADAHVIYVEHDATVAEIGRELLAGEGARHTRLITADMRDAASILDHRDTQALIDFTKPVAILFMAVLHCLGDDDHPKSVMNALCARLVPGSYVAISHLATEGSPPEERQNMADAYKNATYPLVYRDIDKIKEFFDDFELLPPGLVPNGAWYPGEARGDALKRMYGGVARK